MRMSMRTPLELCFLAVTMLLGVTSDAFLLSVFKLHLKRALTFPEYWPISTRSGRRNRGR